MPGQISGIHGLACPSETVVYTAEFINWRSQKFILHPEANTEAILRATVDEIGHKIGGAKVIFELGHQNDIEQRSKLQ